MNAASIAAARGLRVHETRKAQPASGAAGSVLSIELKTSSEDHHIKGAVLHGRAPRLLAIDGIDVEAPLEKNLIYLRNRDVPGVIGRVGTILGDHKINIADFSLGRGLPGAELEPKKDSREAIAVVHIDGSIPDEVIAELRQIAAVEHAKAIRLF